MLKFARKAGLTAVVSLFLVARPVRPQQEVALFLSVDGDRTSRMSRDVAKEIEDSLKEVFGWRVTRRKDLEKLAERRDLDLGSLTNNERSLLTRYADATLALAVEIDRLDGEPASMKMHFTSMDLGAETVLFQSRIQLQSAASEVVATVHGYLQYTRATTFCSGYLASKQLEDALRNCARALDVNPGGLRALSMRSELLIALGRWEEAKRDLQLVVQAGRYASAIAAITMEHVLRELGEREPTVKKEYDRFADETQFATEVFGGDVKYYGVYTCPGRGGCLPMSIRLYLGSSGKRWRFLKNRRLFVLADGERFEFGSLPHDGKVTLRGVQELMVAEVALENFVTISESDSVELRLGNTEFKLSLGALQAFRALLPDGS